MKVVRQRNSIFKSIGHFVLLIAAALIALPLLAQYPGQVTTKSSDKKTPTLRAISVYEWTGAIDKPNACRLIPVMVYDGEKMQDATVYLSRPEPMALAPEVEYELQLNGHSVALFDVKHAALVQGAWVGLGAPKPLPKPKVARSKKTQIKIDDFGDTDKPVLHRKHPAKTSPDSKAPDSSSDSNTPSTAPEDPDRPKLHRKPSTDNSSSTTSTNTGSGTSTNSSSTDTTSTSITTTANNDPDRPQLHRPKPKPEATTNSLDSIDPDRPRLRHGIMGNFQLDVVPGIKGLPADLDQAVAVSDAVGRPDHPWNFSWFNPDDADKMKSALEQIARDALGMTPPPVPKPKSKTATKQIHAKAEPPSAPPPLSDVNFRAFELTYNSGATLVLTANNGQTGKALKYVTLIAQPDLYGNPLILLKQVTDVAHLDTTPRMRLVDAVDALADNRGELLFELRTTDDRQFALYRVLRGTAEKIFVSGGNPAISNP